MLFHRSFIGTDARVFHVTFPQRISKCDAGIHEETFTRVVLSGDTTMFQDIGEHIPTTSAPGALQTKVVCSSKV